jgi:ABC-type dipeptide/oligopeptide/nickel transport system ATPase component
MAVSRPPGPDHRRSDNRAAPDALIELRNVKTHFHTDRGIVPAVDGVDLVIPRDRLLGVVGESGCGKTVMALTIMGLLASPPARVSGEILYHRRNGEVVDLAKLDPKGRDFRTIRGAEIAMIFQEPMTSLNPVFTIGDQIMEAIRLHQKVNAREARARAIAMLERVGIPSPERRVDDYPRQLSGGMRQRAMIAMAMSCNPALLIADEPTTALDVTIQAQIVELMGRLQEEMRTAIVMITHDLGVVAGMADAIAVMYLGQVVESARFVAVMRSLDLRPELSRIDCPALVVVPSNDPEHALAEYEVLRDGIRGLRFVVVDAAYHNITDAIPDRCARELHAFLTAAHA